MQGNHSRRCATILDTDLSSGRMLNETDLNNRSPVAVVGTDIVEHLMAGTDPLGKEIRIDGWTYQVIGVGKKKGKTLGQSADNYVMIPITVLPETVWSPQQQHRHLRPRPPAPAFRSTRPSTKRASRCAPGVTTARRRRQFRN